MALCLNRDGLEYSTLKERSGISGFKLDVMVSHYLEKFGRFPRLDELPGSDSSISLLRSLGDLKAKEEGDFQTVTIKDISKLKEYVVNNKDSEVDIHECCRIINSMHSDLQIELTSIGQKKVKMQFRKLPTKYDQMDEPKLFSITQEKASEYNSIQLLNNIIERVFIISGRNIIKITDAELASPKWSRIVHGKSTAKAFIYQGDVYINVDHASIDDTLHELLHIVLGGVNHLDHNLYMSILDSLDTEETKKLQDDPNYRNKSYIDILEEVLVREVSKHVTGQKSMIQGLDTTVQEQLFENIAKAFDRATVCKSSATTINKYDLLNGSLYQISKYLGERSIDDTVLEFSQLHRQVANTKEKLIKSNRLEEVCE